MNFYLGRDLRLFQKFIIYEKLIFHFTFTNSTLIPLNFDHVPCSPYIFLYSKTFRFHSDLQDLSYMFRVSQDVVRNVFVFERKTGFTSSIWKNRHKERVGYAVLSECDSFRGVPCDDISFEIPSLAFPFTPFTIRTQLRIMRDSFRRNALNKLNI